MIYYLRLKDDKHKRCYKVIEAVSLKAAVNAIYSAQITGSIGHTDIRTEHIAGKPINEWPSKTLAKVIRVNSDYSEAIPYQKAY